MLNKIATKLMLSGLLFSTAALAAVDIDLLGDKSVVQGSTIKLTPELLDRALKTDLQPEDRVTTVLQEVVANLVAKVRTSTKADATDDVAAVLRSKLADVGTITLDLQGIDDGSAADAEALKQRVTDELARQLGL